MLRNHAAPPAVPYVSPDGVVEQSGATAYTAPPAAPPASSASSPPPPPTGDALDFGTTDPRVEGDPATWAGDAPELGDAPEAEEAASAAEAEAWEAELEARIESLGQFGTMFAEAVTSQTWDKPQAECAALGSPWPPILASPEVRSMMRQGWLEFAAIMAPRVARSKWSGPMMSGAGAAGAQVAVAYARRRRDRTAVDVTPNEEREVNTPGGGGLVVVVPKRRNGTAEETPPWA